MRIHLILFVCISLGLVSCTKEADVELMVMEDNDIVESRSYPNADKRLWPYFQAFEEAAKERGLNFDLKGLNILGVIQQIDEAGVAGHCKYGSHIDNEVTLAIDFWNRAGARSKEFVVFHELGHCVLLRGHNESVFDNGACRSMMRSGLEDCRDNYNEVTRSSYLDELFSEIN